MAKDEFDGFQKGGDAQGGAFQWQQPVLPPKRPTLEIDTNVDFTKLGAFSSQKIDVDAIFGQTAKPEGLQTQVDLAKLGNEVRRIKQTEKSERVRDLLERANALIEAQQFRKAATVLDEALKIEPGSPPVMLTKAFVLAALEDFPGAIAIIRRVRDAAPDRETLTMTIFLEAACTERFIEHVTRRVAELARAGKLSEALALVDAEAARVPDNVVLTYHRCGVLLAMGRVADAKRAALKTVARAPGAQSLFGPILGHIAVLESGRFVDAARKALRAGNAGEALSQLEQCRAALGGQSDFEAIRSYADSRIGRGVLSSVFRKDRPRSLSDAELQNVLLWLLSDELSSGSSALNDKKYSDALALFERADQIDPRCTAVRYLMALTLMQRFQDVVSAKQISVSLEELMTMLTNARASLVACAQEPMLAKQYRALNQSIDRYSAQLNELGRERDRHVAEAKPINELFEEFKTFMEGLSIRSLADLKHAEKAMENLKKRAQTLHGRTKSEEGRKHLAALIATLDSHLQQAAAARSR